MCFFFFKQKTAYEMRISDWSSDVCSSDLIGPRTEQRGLSARTHRSGPAAYRPSRRHAARMARGWRRSYAERRRSTGWHRDPVLWTAFWTRRRRAPLSFADRTDTSTRVGSALGPEAVGHLPKRRGPIEGILR